MRDTIVEKLRPILKGPPHAERDVLYVFVEIRKLLDLLLESADEVKRAEFATLKFFCDWVVHVKLDRSGARQILTLLDSELSRLPVAADGSGRLVGIFTDAEAVQPESELYQFISLDRLREQMQRFYRETDLPDLWATHPGVLRECLRFYGNIVLNCPLAFTGRGTTGRYIRELTLTKVVDKDEPPDKRCFLWEWSFEFSDGSSLTLTHTYGYPSQPWDRSGPIMGEFGL
jgi:hypothetical protein